MNTRMVNKFWTRRQIEHKLHGPDKVKHTGHVLSMTGYQENCFRCQLLVRHTQLIGRNRGNSQCSSAS